MMDGNKTPMGIAQFFHVSKAMANAVISGAEQADMDTEKYELQKLNIQNCIGCRKCLFKDDMAAVFETVKTADIVLIAMPLILQLRLGGGFPHE